MLLRSFGYALRGMWETRHGHNMRIHLVAAVVVTGLLIGYSVTGAQLAVVVTNIAVVLGAETMNTAVEELCDLVAKVGGLDYPDSRIKPIKDKAAGAVLFVAIGAGTVGLVVFGPYILASWRG